MEDAAKRLICVCVQGTAASTKNKLPTLITSMETIGAKALEEFADSIKATLTPERHRSASWLIVMNSVLCDCRMILIKSTTCPRMEPSMS